MLQLPIGLEENKNNPWKGRPVIPLMLIECMVRHCYSFFKSGKKRRTNQRGSMQKTCPKGGGDMVVKLFTLIPFRLDLFMGILPNFWWYIDIYLVIGINWSIPTLKKHIMTHNNCKKHQRQWKNNDDRGYAIKIFSAYKFFSFSILNLFLSSYETVLFLWAHTICTKILCFCIII